MVFCDNKLIGAFGTKTVVRVENREHVAIPRARGVQYRIAFDLILLYRK